LLFKKYANVAQFVNLLPVVNPILDSWFGLDSKQQMSLWSLIQLVWARQRAANVPVVIDTAGLG